MSLTRHFSQDNIVLFFMYFYLVFFAILSFMRDNTEFLYYAVVLILCLFVLEGLHKKLRFPVFILVIFALYGLLHFIGGLFTYKGTLIYELNFLIFGYDNLIHTITSFLLAFVGFSLLEPSLIERVKKRKFYFGFLIFIVGFGLASLGEIIELTGVVFLGATTVGDYLNNAVDILFNAIGSLIASLILVRHYAKKDLIKVKPSKS